MKAETEQGQTAWFVLAVQHKSGYRNAYENGKDYACRMYTFKNFSRVICHALFKTTKLRFSMFKQKQSGENRC